MTARARFFRLCVGITIAAGLLLGGCGKSEPDSGRPGQEQTQAPAQPESETPRGAAPSDREPSPQTLTLNQMMGAALEGSLNTVQQAVEQGLDVNGTDQAGRTPLMMASYNGHTQVVRYLLDQGADVHASNAEGRTPLIFAASGPFPETVELLLESDADPNLTDDGEQWTALMFAAAGGHTEVVQVLLDHGADPSLQDEDGETALDFARSNNHTEVVKLLEGG